MTPVWVCALCRTGYSSWLGVRRMPRPVAPSPSFEAGPYWIESFELDEALTALVFDVPGYFAEGSPRELFGIEYPAELPLGLQDVRRAKGCERERAARVPGTLLSVRRHGVHIRLRGDVALCLELDPLLQPLEDLWSLHREVLGPLREMAFVLFPCVGGVK